MKRRKSEEDPSKTDKNTPKPSVIIACLRFLSVIYTVISKAAFFSEIIHIPEELP
jgi:hypothetical protein